MTKQATPCKLRDGTWGARVASADVAPGDAITITTRAGKRWDAIVARVVWRGDGVAIVSTASTASTASSSSSHHSSSQGVRSCGERHRGKCCISGGDCSSFGAGRSCGAYCCDGY